MVAGLDEGRQRASGGNWEAKISKCLCDLDLCSCVELVLQGRNKNFTEEQVGL